MERKYKFMYAAIAAIGLTTATFSCSKSSDTAVAASKNLYIASGKCNSGLAITTYTNQTSSRLVSKVNLSSGALSYFVDLSSPYSGGLFLAETSPQSLVSDGNNILMLTDNNGPSYSERKVFSIPKASPFNLSLYSSDTNALTNAAPDITRALVKDVDGTLLFSKSISIEKLGTNQLRIPSGANSWINAPAAPCATSTTLISSMVLLPPFAPATTGKVLFAHNALVAANNRLAVVSQDGYSSAPDCRGGTQVSLPVHSYASNITGPAIAFPAVEGVNVTAMQYISTGTGTGKLITAYSAASAAPADLNNGTNQNYALVLWDVSETATTATINNPVILYRDFSIIFGVSAMAYDSTTNHLYVAAASQPGSSNQTSAGYGYKVEKFLLDINAPSLTLIQANNKPYLDRSSATKCISSMIVAD